MNVTSKIAIAAALFSAIASSCFAGDQDSAALQAGSGRLYGAQLMMPSDAYASATWVSPRHRVMAVRTWSTTMALNDRLAQGHN
jgi:hypothetical protein